MAKADCLRLAAILDEYPLRGRKSADYAIWKSALRWWIGGDPTARRPGRDWTAMAYLAKRLRAMKSYGAAARLDYSRDRPGLTGDWPPFLAGFLTAEGHFGLAEDAGRVRPRMRVNARGDDLPLLAELARRTGVGRLYSYPRKPYEASRMASWVVFSARDLRRLVEILDGCPIRGRKLSVYAIWREAIGLLRPGKAADQVELHHLAEQLQNARAYDSVG